MRLIDADALMELFDERLDSAHLQTVTRRTGKTLWSGIYGGVNWGRNTVADAPTIDAVPVVRCRECKHSRELNKTEWTCVCADALMCENPEAHADCCTPMWPDDFCSYGERKDG